MSEPTEPVAAQAPQSAAQTPASAAAQAPDQDAPSTTAQAASPEAEPAQATATEPEPGFAPGLVAEASSEPVADDAARFAVDTPDNVQGEDAPPGEAESDLEKSAAPAASDAAAPASPDAGAAAAEMGPAACAARLIELFPALFGGEGPPRPVKLRIHADIQQRAPGVFTRKALSIFLHRHTTGNAYLRALINAPHRFDLDGQPAGEVLEEHRAAARDELERRRQIHLARRAAERVAGGRPPGPPGPPGPSSPSGADAASADGPDAAGPRAERRGRPPRGMGAEAHGQRGPREPRAPFGRGAPQGPARNAAEAGVASAPGSRAAPPQAAGAGPDGRDRRPPRPMRDAQGAERGRHGAHEARNAGGRRADGDAAGRRGGGEQGRHRGGSDGRHRGPMAADRAPPGGRPFQGAPAGPGGRDRPPPRRPEGDDRGAAPGAEGPAARPEDTARRERASLLRTFEASPLSKANFCVLKRISETDLDTLLAQARRERDERGARPMTSAA